MQRDTEPARPWGPAPRPARSARSPGACRGGGLDGADAQAIGRVLQGLQLLLIWLVVTFHGAIERGRGRWG